MEKSKRNITLISIVGIIFFLFVAIRRAWMCDDAFITLRTIDNFVNGYGLTWNVTERVQAYTHPLWMLIISLFYFFTREPFYTVIIISLIFSGLALYILLKYFGRDSLTAILSIIILTFSRSFVDFSTSGLENPLGYLLIVIFFIIFLVPINVDEEKRLFFLSLVASLGLITRMDYILIFAPPLLLSLWNYHKWKGLWIILIGQIPFISWEIFSLLYYGFLVPNTAFAKLAHGVSRIVLLRQGITYFYHSIINDPLSMLFIGIGLIIPFFSSKKKSLFIVSIGIMLYLIYIIWIGGDFMSGRFFSIPLLVSTIIIMNVMPSFTKNEVFILIGLALILGLIIPFNTLTLDIEEYSFSENCIDDERLYFFPGMSLITRHQNHMQPEFKWKEQGIEYRDSGNKVTHARAIGLFGYYCGPGVYIIDGHGLADPLLSHLKTPLATQYMSGHILKEVPEGYRESLNLGINEIKDSNLREYYDKILLITRGEIFSWDRIQTIFEINTGQYDYLLN